MQIQKSFSEEDTGKLYLVPTPIGNLQDMTYRSVATLQEVDLIAAEDTRNTIKVLNHFEITTPQISLHEHNYKKRIPQLLERLMAGENIAQVSDAGMPSISDPGHELVVACVEKGIQVVALPGATAGMTALIASGLLPQPFSFVGFFSRKKKEQQEFLATQKNKTETQIYYESPFRMKETLGNLLAVFGVRQAVICRELTKIHEEYLRGTIEELLDYVSATPLKGECVLMVAGNGAPVEEAPEIEMTMAEEFEKLRDEGLTDKEIVKSVAARRKLKKQDVYKVFHEL